MLVPHNIVMNLNNVMMDYDNNDHIFKWVQLPMLFIESILGIKGHMVANQCFKYVWVDNNTKMKAALPKMYASLPRV